jgi:ATP-dependent DNA helicase PIF1
MQLILVGDFCQLPPAGKAVSRYCFEVVAWTKCINHTVNLTQVYRQKTNWFVRYLQMIRFGVLPKNCWENMLNWLGREPKFL